MSNYPEGSDNSRAPWNQADAVDKVYEVRFKIDLIVDATNVDDAIGLAWEQLRAYHPDANISLVNAYEV